MSKRDNRTETAGLTKIGDLLADVLPAEIDLAPPPPPSKLLLTKRGTKRVAGIERVRAKREAQDQQLGYLAKPFILCGFPFKRITDTTLYERKNGDEVSSITANPKYGLPFGADIQVPIWISTLAVQQMQGGRIPREIEFSSAAQMLKAFDLPLDGRTYRRMQERFIRVFYSTYFYGREGQRAQLYSFRFFDEIDLWFTRDLDTGTLPGDDFKNNRVKISEAFAADLERNRPPIDLDMVRLWADKPGQLFFALWLCYRCFTARGRVQIPLMGPGGVYQQCGVTGYTDPERGPRNFRMKIKKWLAGLKLVWPECPVDLIIDPRGDLLVIEGRAAAIHPRKF